ncbi:MAG: hypothetical protein U1F50_05520 [Rubrivivax sp.]
MARKEDDDLPWPPPPQRTARRPGVTETGVFRTFVPEPGQVPPRPAPEDLADPATQIVRDREDYLGQGQREVGRRISDDKVELFVSIDPASALLQQFERLAPEFIALHDVGTTATLRLLGALASAAGARVQQLSVRRQGQGVALAVIQFVEIPLGKGTLRLYSTDINADSQTRQSLAQVLLSRARLGVLMVGELPGHVLATALKPLRESIQRGPWPNRDLLLLPLGSATTLATQGAQLAGSSGVVVRVTPQATRPNDAWSFISGVWNRMQGADLQGAALETDITRAVPRPRVPRPEAPTQPMPLSPAPAPAVDRWVDYARRCAAVKGVVACCVFDTATRKPLAHTGEISPERLAEQGLRLVETMAGAAATLGLSPAMPEGAVTVGQQHLLLKAVPGHESVVVHLVLHASASNLTLARMQLERVGAPV